MSRMAQEFQKQLDEMRGKGACRQINDPKPLTIRRKTPLKRTRVKTSARKRAKNKTEDEVIEQVRVVVFELDPKCICGECPSSDRDQMHEIVPRSQTRGMAPEERFNRRNCVRVSQGCHELITGTIGKGKVLKITMHDDKRGADGGLMLTWKTGKIVMYQRKKR